MHLQVAILFLEHEGRTVPWQHKSLLVGCLFLEIMKEEEKEGARSSSCNFLLSVIVFGMFLLFLFCSHGSPAQCAGFLCETEVASAAHGVDVLLGSSGQAEGEDEAAPAAGPPWGPQGAGDSQGSRGYPGRAALQDWHLDPADLSLRREVKPGEHGLGHKGKTWKLKGYSRRNYFAVLDHEHIFVLLSHRHLKTQEVPKIWGHILPLLCLQEGWDSAVSVGSAPPSSWQCTLGRQGSMQYLEY